MITKCRNQRQRENLLKSQKHPQIHVFFKGATIKLATHFSIETMEVKRPPKNDILKVILNESNC